MKYETIVAFVVGTILAGIIVLGVVTLLALVTGCGGVAFTESPGTAADPLLLEGGPGTPDAAPTSPQDALSDAGGYDGAAEWHLAPPTDAGPEACSATCSATPSAPTVDCAGLCAGACSGTCSGPGTPPFQINGAQCGTAGWSCTGQCGGTCYLKSPSACSGTCAP
jgi:hypothetical protein